MISVYAFDLYISTIDANNGNVSLISQLYHMFCESAEHTKKNHTFNVICLVLSKQ